MNLSDLRDRFADCLRHRSRAAIARHFARKSERSLILYKSGYRIASGQHPGALWREQRIAYVLTNALASEVGVFKTSIGQAKNAFSNCVDAMLFFGWYVPHVFHDLHGFGIETLKSDRHVPH